MYWGPFQNSVHKPKTIIKYLINIMAENMDFLDIVFEDEEQNNEEQEDRFSEGGEDDPEGDPSTYTEHLMKTVL